MKLINTSTKHSLADGYFHAVMWDLFREGLAENSPLALIVRTG